jgi:hypothetical protein
MATRTLFPQPEPEPTLSTEQTCSLHLVCPIPFSAQTKSLETRLASVSATNLEDLPAASDLLQSVLSLKAAIVRHQAEPKQQAYEAHQAACRAEHDDLDPVIALEEKLKSIIGALELERRRQQEEAQRADRRATEQAAAELQEELIEAAEKSGVSSTEIASLCQMSMSVPVPAPVRVLERPKGFSTTDQFLVEVTDVKTLAQAVLDGKAPAEVIQANLKVLTGMAKALKGNLQLPGVSIIRKVSISGRRTR